MVLKSMKNRPPLCISLDNPVIEKGLILENKYLVTLNPLFIY